MASADSEKPEKQQPLYAIVPTTARLRLFGNLALEGGSLDGTTPIEALEHGVDFVRYAVKRQ